MATYKKVNEETPNGGAYSEILFFDSNGNSVDETKAKKFVIRECDESGELIAETWGFTETEQQN